MSKICRMLAQGSVYLVGISSSLEIEVFAATEALELVVRMLENRGSSVCMCAVVVAGSSPRDI